MLWPWSRKPCRVQWVAHKQAILKRALRKLYVLENGRCHLIVKYFAIRFKNTVPSTPIMSSGKNMSDVKGIYWSKLTHRWCVFFFVSWSWHLALTLLTCVDVNYMFYQKLWKRISPWPPSCNSGRWRLSSSSTSGSSSLLSIWDAKVTNVEMQWWWCWCMWGRMMVY